MTAMLIANLAPLMFAALVVFLLLGYPVAFSLALFGLRRVLRYGYDRARAAGLVPASGPLAQIIPPSLVLIVMADQLGRSVGDMYQGAFIPGLSLAALYAVFVFVMTLVRPGSAPALPPAALTMREDNGKAGYPSLLAVAVLAALAAYLLTGYMHAIWACGLAGLGAY